VQELVDNGFRRDDISLVAQHEGETITERGDDRTSGVAVGAGAGAAVGGLGGLLVGLSALAIPGVGPVLAAGPLATTLAGAGLGAAAGGLLGALTDLGVPEEEAHYYAEGVRRGGALVTVETDDQMADRAAEIMGRFGAIDVDERAGHWRQSGWTRFDPAAGPYRATERPAVAERQTAQYTTAEPQRPAAGTARERDLAATTREGAQHRTVDQGEVKVPIVEEQLEVGKRRVERGGVRLYTRVIERPIEETVRLRDETVRVERHPVDRPASEADITAFKEGTVEVTETDEEAVVTKRTRVVEEVVVSKEVDERTETVRDAARRTEVEVEPIGSEQTRGYRGFDTYDADFRSHYNTSLASRGHAYERWAPGYRYGYDLASDRQYAGKDWTAIEPEARRRWEERHQGTWEEFKDTVRYAWDKVRGHGPETGREHTGSERTTATDYRSFDTYNTDFRSHYNTSLASRGHAYDYWAPSYRYGYDLASDRRYAGSDWAAVEPEARRRWEEGHQGTWEEFKDTIRYAWDKVRGRR
jgi:uncharacterized protein (TIGR02271 family)